MSAPAEFQLTPPSPLVEEGGVGGREAKALSRTAAERPSKLASLLPTPTPNPCPQGGGEL